MKLIADINLAPNGGFTGFGALGLEGKSSFTAPQIFATFLSSAIGVITIIAIIWFIFLFITGAVSFMTAGGDKNAVESAKKKILNGVVGLAVVVFGLIIIKLIGVLIGLPDILNFSALFFNINK